MSLRIGAWEMKGHLMATITAGNQNELDKALQDVKDGDTILLEGGTYDFLDLSSSGRQGFDFDKKVTIASADARDQAKIEHLYVREASNIELRDLVFDYETGPATQRPLTATRKFWVENSVDITFDGVTFDGDKVDSYGEGLGLRVKGSKGVSVLNSEFVDFEMAMSFQDNEDTIIANNAIRGISFDAMMLSDMEDVTIAYNEFTDFHSRHLLHQDAIQFLTSTTAGPSNEVKIVGNRIDNPEESHGIWLGNSLYAEKGQMGVYYTNVYIADNILHTADKLAIGVMHGDNIVVERNVLTKNNDEGVEKNTPLINISKYSKNVFILDNEVAGVPGEENGSWVVEGNKTTPGRYEFWQGVYPTTNVNQLLSQMPNKPADPYRPVIDVRPNDHEPGGPDSPGDPDGPVGPDPDEPDGDGDGVGAEVRLKGDMRALYDGGVTITGFDFAEGDEIVFALFDRRTFIDEFGGNFVNDYYRGASVRIDSALDIQELAANSRDFHAYASGKDLVIEIDQGRGTAEVTIAGLADAFLAADHPELF